MELLMLKFVGHPKSKEWYNRFLFICMFAWQILHFRLTEQVRRDMEMETNELHVSNSTTNLECYSFHSDQTVTHCVKFVIVWFKNSVLLQIWKYFLAINNEIKRVYAIPISYVFIFQCWQKSGHLLLIFLLHNRARGFPRKIFYENWTVGKI